MIQPSSLRVLIVDDKSMMRDLTRRTLEHLGFVEIFGAANAAEGLAKAREHRVDLIISDYQMPEMSGLELLALVRKDPLLSGIGFIMLSGSGDMDVVRRARDLRASSYLLKPFSLQGLKQHIEQIFGTMETVRRKQPVAASPSAAAFALA